ncbi:hypothetical protein ACFLXC_02510 [Chloroflexota bacterium]
MNRGCISLGEIKCDQCKRNVRYPERYLLVVEKNKKRHLCVPCSVKNGLARQMKGDKGVTFLGGDSEDQPSSG